jgi:hypothetical protein
MIKNLTGGWNIITYTGEEPKKALLKKDYYAPVVKVHITMRDSFGNKYEDTTELKGNTICKEKDGFEVVDNFIQNIAWLRESMPIKMDNKTYANVKIITVEILDETTELMHYLEEVVSPEQY